MAVGATLHRNDADDDPTAPSTPTAFEYQPALDGLRGVAVVLVLLFHSGFTWLPAGYLGVSVFFTLSGFLITSLILTEANRTGSIRLGAFFGRRLKRLLPAGLLCVGVVAGSRVLGSFGSVPGFRAETIGAVANVYNWVKIAGDTSYTGIFAAPALTSPLEHYWSLAIEEQFYLVWPFVMLWMIRRARRTGRGTAADLVDYVRPRLIGAFVLGAVAAPVIAMVFGSDVAYWSTPTRLPELLAGAALAAWSYGRTAPAWFAGLAFPALVLIVLASMLLPSSSGPAYSGYLGVFALLSVVLILGLQAASPVRDALSASPIVFVGRLSYGIYLFHWPIYTFARQQGWDLTEPSRFVSVNVIVFVVAAVSFYAFERPIRRSRAMPKRTIPFAVGALLVGVATFAVAPFGTGFLEADGDQLARVGAVPVDDLTPLISSTDSSPVSASPAAPFVTDVPLGAELDRPVRILVVGDSTSFSVATGLAQFASDHPDYASLDALWCPGCGFIREGTNTTIEGGNAFADRAREVFELELPEVTAQLSPDVVVLMNSVEDLVDREWSSDEGPLTPFDPVFQERMLQSYQDITNSLLDRGVPLVVWVKPPVPRWISAPEALQDPERWSVMNDVIDQVSEQGGNSVTSVDLATWTQAAGYEESESFRFDGVHISDDAAAGLAERWLGPILVDAVRTRVS